MRTTSTSTPTVGRAAALTAAALLVLAGCGSDGDVTPAGAASASGSAAPSEPASPSTSPTSGGSPSASPSGAVDGTRPADDATAPVAFPADTAADTADASDDAMLTVTDVRAGAHDGFDRVVFDLGGTGTPGWSVEYVDAAVDEGSGEPVDVDGDAVLQILITGTGMPMDTGVEEYSGAPVDLDGESVEQVVYRFVYEGRTAAFAGLDEVKPFRVFALEDPARVVVDVQH